MPKSYPRRHRIEALVQQALAPLLTTLLGKHRPITIRRVSLNNDFSVATISYTIIGSATDDAQQRLDAEQPQLRLHLARRLNMRKTPALHFIHDAEGLADDKMRQFLEHIALSPSERDG